LQPLWNADFIGPEGCKIEILNGPSLKNKSMVVMNFMLKTT